MIVSTTPGIEGRPIRQYLGIVNGEAIIGANIFRDMFAAVRNIVGGRAAGYENALNSARETAMNELVERARQLGANAIVGNDIDYEVLGEGGSMLMVAASGTAVPLPAAPTSAPVTAPSTNWMLPSNADALPATVPCGSMASAVVLGPTKPCVAM